MRRGADSGPFPAAIREARRGDVDIVVGMWVAMMAYHYALDHRFHFAADAPASYASHVRMLMKNRLARVYVAESDGTVAGFITAEVARRPPVYPVGQYGFIADMFVDPAYRRRGIGRALFEQTAKWLRSCGVTSIELLAAERNAEGAAFWRAMGFEPYLQMLRYDVSREPNHSPDDKGR